MSLAERFGLWRCSRGHHVPLVWEKRRRGDVEQIAASSRAAEMSYAAGLYDLAKYLGRCPRCRSFVEWADFNPVKR